MGNETLRESGVSTFVKLSGPDLLTSARGRRENRRRELERGGTMEGKWHPFEGFVRVMSGPDHLGWITVRCIDGEDVVTTAAQLFDTEEEARAEFARVMGGEAP